MNSRLRRLKAIELDLTPFQVVLLWMRNALKGTIEQAVLEFPPPRAAIANSVTRIVRNSLKKQPETIVERAITQARQEADLFYCIVTSVCASSSRKENRVE